MDNSFNDPVPPSANIVKGIVGSSLSEKVGGYDLLNEHSDENTTLKNNVIDYNLKHAACEDK